MDQKVVLRYSNCFKRQIVDELEKGRFGSISEVNVHYDIRGKETVKNWLRRYGRNHLCAKVVRVEKPDEKNQMKELRQQVKQLQQLLGRKEVEKALDDAYLEIACEELGMDVESFKKKGNGRVLREPSK